MLHFEKMAAVVLSITMVVYCGTPTYPPPQAIRMVEAAWAGNPTLASSRLNASASQAAATGSQAWKPPEVSVDFFSAPVSSFPNPISKEQHEIDYSISQSIPFPGKRKAMAGPEKIRGQIAEKRTESLRLSLRREVLSAYATGVLTTWKLRLLSEDQAEMQRLLGVARAGYESGLGSQVDLLRAETEAARMESDAFEMKRMQIENKSQFKILLGNPMDTLSLESPSPVPSPNLLSHETLIRLALERRPDIEAMRKERSMSEAEISAVKKEVWPDLMLRGMYKNMRHLTQDDWSLMVGMEIPIAPWSWKGIRAETRRVSIGREQAEHNLKSIQLSAQGEIEFALSALESAWGRMELAKLRRIPVAEQMLRASLTSYQGGKIGFGDVIIALRELRMAKETYHVAASDHLKSWADLEWATGGELP